MENYKQDIFMIMINDFLTDNADEMEDLELCGNPYFRDGRWMQDAEDKENAYVLWGDEEGNVHIEYAFTK